MSSCPKCNGSMSEGFVVDRDYGSTHVSTFQPGKPRKTLFGVKQSKKDQVTITSMRCSRCGFLEHYARG